MIDDFHGQSKWNLYVFQIIKSIGKYVFSITLKEDTDILRIKHNGIEYDVSCTFTFSETMKSGTNLVISIIFLNVNQGNFLWKDVMIERGSKATEKLDTSARRFMTIC